MRALKFTLAFLVTLVVLFISSFLILNFSFPKIENSISILVLGKGGEGHTAPNLTDTIMVALLSPELKKITFLSLPRDIWVPEIRAKINTAYHYGGFKMARDSVGNIIDRDIDNIIVIDFNLFKDLIDAMGGIEVEVENFFSDEKYPIAGLENDLCNGDILYRCRYETLKFDKGIQNMNGEVALKFVRSRNAIGDEGTDIAREKRQQKVIEAIKEKILSNDILLNPKKIKSLYKVFIDHVETDIDKDTAITLLKFLLESKNNINFLSIPEDMLIVSQNDKKYDRQYVFVPKSGTWKELQGWIRFSLLN